MDDACGELLAGARWPADQDAAVSRGDALERVAQLVDRGGRSQRGLLSLGDIYALKLPADLVVLSACQTALGREYKGEALLGLTSGFLHAGARRVISTAWKIDDEATAHLMAAFYQAMLKDKLAPAAALRDERKRPTCLSHRYSSRDT